MTVEGKTETLKVPARAAGRVGEEGLSEKGRQRRQLLKTIGRGVLVISGGVAAAKGVEAVAKALSGSAPDIRSKGLTEKLDIQAYLPLLRQRAVLKDTTSGTEEGMVNATWERPDGQVLVQILDNSGELEKFINVPLSQITVGGRSPDEFIKSGENAPKSRPMADLLQPENYYQLKGMYAIYQRTGPPETAIYAASILPGVAEAARGVPIAYRDKRGDPAKDVVSAKDVFLEPDIIARIKDGELMLDDTMLSKEAKALRESNPQSFKSFLARANSVFKGEESPDIEYFRGYMRKNFGRQGPPEYGALDVDAAINYRPREFILNQLVVPK